MIAEITHDMAAAAPMHRLLQGDVGSGKTVVALVLLLVAVQGGYQGAFMAPTEVLAEQHYLGSVKMLEGLTVSADQSLLGDRPVRVELLTNRTTAAERRRIAKGLANNEVDILVGTHALLHERRASSRSSAVAVIDEQHQASASSSGPACSMATAGADVAPARPRDDRHADPADGLGLTQSTATSTSRSSASFRPAARRSRPG